MNTKKFLANIEVVSTPEMESLKGGGKVIIIKEDGTIIVIE